VPIYDETENLRLDRCICTKPCSKPSLEVRHKQIDNFILKIKQKKEKEEADRQTYLHAVGIRLPVLRPTMVTQHFEAENQQKQKKKKKKKNSHSKSIFHWHFPATSPFNSGGTC
jgi:CO dehydrogenase/acetyl-CoA synthase alpha subunit